MDAAKILWKRYPWPHAKPNVPPNDQPIWINDATVQVFHDKIPSNAKVILELGSWKGVSTRLLAGVAKGADVIAVDTWRGSEEHTDDTEVKNMLETLYDTFLVNCWDYRDRIIPLRMTTLEGMENVADAGVQPDAVYVDAAHDTHSVLVDTETAVRLFPNARIIGDDFSWKSVADAVQIMLEKNGWAYGWYENTWWLQRNM